MEIQSNKGFERIIILYSRKVKKFSTFYVLVWYHINIKDFNLSKKFFLLVEKMKIKDFYI